jgi:hypothetical protein
MYNNSSEVYFPIKAHHLKNVARVELVSDSELDFKLVLNNSKEYYFRTDSNISALEWVKMLGKSIFKAKMAGIEHQIVVLINPDCCSSIERCQCRSYKLQS